MKKKIISLFFAFVFCFHFFVINSVSAAETFELSLESFSYNVSDTFIKPIIETAYNKTIATENNYVPENSYFFYNSQNVYLVLKDDIVTTNRQFAYYNGSTWLYRPLLIFSKGIQFNATASNSGSLFTSVQSGNYTTFGIVDTNPNPFNYSRYYVGGLYYDANYGHYSTNQLNSNYPTYFETSYIPPYVPPPSVLYGLDLDINETDFYNWIIDNNKLVELPTYITSNKLMSFIQFYKKFGGSFSNFLKNIPDWFSYMNIVNQSADNVNVLKSSMDKLYQEYINSYWHVIYPDFSNIPTHRRNIHTNTTDTNTTLITDDSNDTVDISILRDILRGIISINNSISDGVISLINKLDQLDFTVNVANGGGSFSAAEIWGSGDITESNNFQTLVSAFENRGVDISAAENLKYNYLEDATQKESFTVSIVMPDVYFNGEFSSKTVTHTIDSSSKMYNTLVLFRKLISFAVIIFYAIRLRFALPQLIRGE